MKMFPKGFLWGASTSAHQVEGNNYNDWTEWEKANATRLASESFQNFSRLSPVWDEIRPQAQDPDNYISGQGANHYGRYEEDFDIAKSLGMNAHRFSIEWSRIEPREGEFDQKELEHYRQVIKALKKRGLEPFVTLWHWPLPLWLSADGGWKSKRSAYYFDRYTNAVLQSLGNEVKFWITLNEPEVYADQAYRVGAWPPGERNLWSNYQVLRNLAKGHIAAYKRIKSLRPDAQIGVAKNNVYFDLKHHFAVDWVIKIIAEFGWNSYFLIKIRRFQDFIGLNQYFHYHHKANRILLNRPHVYTSDLGWELFPDAMYYVLMGLKKYRKPIYITENGLADHKDNYRAWYIKNTLVSVHLAISMGVDVRGYFHWSLLDNFEWDKGFWPRFGLVEIDYKTQERNVRQSAKEYAKIIKANGLEE